jgi:hypothetical protein
MEFNARNVSCWPAPLRRAVDSIAVVLMQVYMLARGRAAASASLVVRILAGRDEEAWKLAIREREMGVFRRRIEAMPPHSRPRFLDEDRVGLLSLSSQSAGPLHNVPRVEEGFLRDLPGENEGVFFTPGVEGLTTALSRTAEVEVPDLTAERFVEPGPLVDDEDGCHRVPPRNATVGTIWARSAIPSLRGRSLLKRISLVLLSLVERATGFEPATSTLGTATRCVTTHEYCSCRRNSTTATAEKASLSGMLAQFWHTLRPAPPAGLL